MNKKEKEYTGVSIMVDTKKRIDKLARKSETYDEFINKVLDIYEEEESEG